MSEKKSAPGKYMDYPTLWFALFPSYQCTRKCGFCYTDRQEGLHGEMDDNTFSRLVEWIPEVYEQSGIKRALIIWLGGEPLLRTDRIHMLSQRLEPHKGVFLQDVFTNADLVDILNWKHLQEVYRFTINTCNTPLDEIRRRVEIINQNRNKRSPWPCTLATTLDDYNLDRLESILRYGLVAGLRFRFQSDMYRIADPDYRSKVLLYMHNACDILEDHRQKGGEIFTEFFFDGSITGWYGYEKSPFFCGKSVIRVNPDGTIGPCIRDAGGKFGDIWSGNAMEAVRRPEYHFKYYRPTNPPDCLECSIRSVCQGGCPVHKRFSTGSWDGRHPMCEVYKEIIPRLLGIA